MWHRPRHLFQGIDSPADRRALQFFSEVAGPFLPGATDPYFWTHVVMQFSDFEPAVRHSVIAISSLYERRQIDDKSNVGLQVDCFALQHYNAAIHEMQNMDNQPLVLLVCILFICIEFLQLNKTAAMQHCKHGVKLLQDLSSKYSWAEEYLVPIFRHLNVFPFFFGGPSDFPELVAANEPVPTTFGSFAEARSMLDTIFSRSMRLVRQGDQLRFGDPDHRQPQPELLAEQASILEYLSRWQIAFMSVTRDLSVPASPMVWHDNFGVRSSQQLLETFLSINYESCEILTKLALINNEVECDSCLDGYRSIIRQAANIDTISDCFEERVPNQPQFVFELGFLPFLSNVALKCRDMKTRLAAMRMTRSLGMRQEGLFDGCSTYALARRTIEIEHGIVLNNLGHPITEAAYPGLPPESSRIRGVGVNADTAVEHIGGRDFTGKIVGCYMLESNGVVRLRTEFLPNDLDAARANGFDNMNQPWPQSHDPAALSTYELPKLCVDA
ncbi:hypothetical protein TruAng_007450 [Truncatella angustata]|nr:hypothetical protein TruAng_007450 [Truncatella angustata]